MYNAHSNIKGLEPIAVTEDFIVTIRKTMDIDSGRFYWVAASDAFNVHGVSGIGAPTVRGTVDEVVRSLVRSARLGGDKGVLSLEYTVNSVDRDEISPLADTYEMVCTMVRRVDRKKLLKADEC